MNYYDAYRNTALNMLSNGKPVGIPIGSAPPLNMPVSTNATPRFTGWTSDWANAQAPAPRYPMAPSWAGSASSNYTAPSGANSSAAYTQRLNSNGALPASGSLSWNRPASSLNGYQQMGQAMNYGSYGGAMGVPVTGLPVYDQMGNPVQRGGGSFSPMTYQQKFGGNAGPARPTMAQQLINDVQAQANAAKQANEQRYDAILNRDQPAMMKAFEDSIRSQYPGMSAENIKKLMADPNRLAQFQAANPQFGGYRDRYTRGMGYLKGAGEQARKDINTDYQKLANQTQMNLNQRGLDSSTLSGSMAAGVERQRQDSIGRLNEQLRKEYMDADARLSGDTLQFMERRNDTYPDQMQIADLMMKFGNAGMLGYTGGGGGYSQPLQYSGTWRKGQGWSNTGFGQPNYNPAMAYKG